MENQLYLGFPADKSTLFLTRKNHKTAASSAVSSLLNNFTQSGINDLV